MKFSMFISQASLAMKMYEAQKVLIDRKICPKYLFQTNFWKLFAEKGVLIRVGG